MDKKIPLTFDIMISSPLTPINESLPNVARAKCHVFTKYRNRNYSYITDEVADQLIASAAQGTVPVVGFFDKEKGDWTSHTGPELASAYGYVESFAGWEKVVDPADGVEREYATFNIVLFSEYLKEANSIVGKKQSMELNPDPEYLAGEWAHMGENDGEYFVYTKARLHALCALGDGVEPCFSGSTFFEKDGALKFEQFSKLLMDLQDKVKEHSGGQNAMNVKVNGVENEHFADVFNSLNPDFTEENSWVINEVPFSMNDTEILTYACGGKKRIKKYSYTISEEGELALNCESEFDYDELTQGLDDLRAEFEAFKTSSGESLQSKVDELAELQNKFDALNAEKEQLQASLEELKATYEALQQEKTTATSEYEAKISERDTTIAEQAATITEYENAEKTRIIEKFSKCLPAENIAGILERKDELSVDALNTSLALEYTQFSMAKNQGEEIRIPQPQQEEESALVKYLKKYVK